MPLEASSTAFVFPGQGSQSVGMGKDLAEAEPLAAETFKQADEVLGLSFSSLCWEGPEEALNATENTQPALLVHSVAVLRVFQSRHPDFLPASVAGHSLGELSALVAAGSLGYEDAIRLVRARGEAMRDAGAAQPGGMAAVLGLQVDQVQAICEQAREAIGAGVWVANDNCPGQVVISGDDQALGWAAAKLSEAGARKVVRLAVSIAAHSPYMSAAQERFADALQAAQIADPRVPVLGNVSAAPLHTAEDVKADLEAQLTANVRWTESIEAMVQSGVDTFIEMGSGKVLTGLIKRIHPPSARLNLDDTSSFAAAFS
jgi:[acyl-carrier-protein] S-malonyltransferase